MGARAGWAEAEITPPLGLPMGGRGPRFTPGARVLDPLMAQALVLEDGAGHRQVWVSLDLIGLDYARSAAVRHDVAALSGADYEAVVLNFAHVHSGPMSGFDKYPTLVPEPPLLRGYLDVLRLTVRRVVATALRRMQPVEVHCHRGVSHLGINRRRRNAQGDMVMAPNPEGHYNPDLWVLELQGTGTGAAQPGGERAVVFSYGCHPVIVYGFAWDGISADYPGATRKALGAHLGRDVHCQFMQGLAGNVRPRVLADLETGTFRKATPADLDQAAGELASDVLTALGDAGETLDLALAAAAGWAHAARDLDRVPPVVHWQALAERDDELSRNVGGYWARRLTSGLPLARSLPLEIGVLQIATSHRVAWIAAEAVAEWLGLLRTRLSDPRLTVWGYSQQVSTYLPTDALLQEGGYEVLDANWYDEGGPGPFASGIDATVGAGFSALMRRLV